MKIDIKFRLLILSLLLTSTGVLLANDVKFTASAPSTVIADKPFQLVYTVNASAKDWRKFSVTCLFDCAIRKNGKSKRNVRLLFFIEVTFEMDN